MEVVTEHHAEGDAILAVDRLSKKFGGLEAVTDFNMVVKRGEIKGLIGPNGAGKSTLFNLISGLYKPTSGSVLFDGENLTGKSPDHIAAKGIGRTFQAVKLLANKSVIETMRTAFFMSYRYNAWDTIFQTRRYRDQEKRFEQEAVKHLTRLGVAHLQHKNGNELAYGLQRKVSIAMTLCLNPKILLLDEPMAGLTHTEKDNLIDILLKLKNDFDLSILLVEHDMKVIMNLCKSISVMNYGRLIANGTAEEIRNNDQVVEAYLGTGDI